MIIGSIYLGKKAKTAYRKHQAEKAAQKLAAPFDIVDPSDEIQQRVPPSSPTGTDVSATNLSVVPSESLSKLGSRSSTSNLSHSTSARSQRKSTEEQEYNHYVQRHSAAEEPPSYDLAVGGNPSPQQAGPLSQSTSTSHSVSQRGSQYTSPPSTASPSSAYPSSTFSDRFHRDCSTCITMMEQFQVIYPHPHNISPVTPRSPPFGHAEQSPAHPPSAVAEMADPSVYQQRPIAEGTGPILEAPDTGSYYSNARSPAVEMPADHTGPVELPTEMPAAREATHDPSQDLDLRELMRADTIDVERESAVSAVETKAKSEQKAENEIREAKSDEMSQ